VPTFSQAGRSTAVARQGASRSLSGGSRPRPGRAVDRPSGRGQCIRDGFAGGRPASRHRKRSTRLSGPSTSSGVRWCARPAFASTG